MNSLKAILPSRARIAEQDQFVDPGLRDVDLVFGHQASHVFTGDESSVVHVHYFERHDQHHCTENINGM